MSKKVVTKKKKPKVEYLPIDIMIGPFEQFRSDGLFEEEDDVKCECGSEKVHGKNNGAHSSWCPKNRP